jgi:phospholipase/carboxylesterase
MNQVLCRETGKNPTLTVIWLHGLGADGNDFVPIVPELKLPEDCAVRFLFPTAPSIPVTINGGFVMPAWYDILSLDGDQRQVDEAGILKSRGLVRQLITEQNAAGIPSHRIVIAGFSQGGAIAWSAALTQPEPLAGIIALSTYLPSLALIERELNAHNLKLPMLAAHGSHDDVVPMSMGMQARDTVESLGGHVEWRAYPMAHAVCLEEIRHIGQWLTQLCRKTV